MKRNKKEQPDKHSRPARLFHGRILKRKKRKVKHEMPPEPKVW